MKLSERAVYYYLEQKQNCAVAILLAANDHYDLGLNREDAELVAGFGGGMGCGSTCGCLAGAIAALGKLFSKRENFRPLCAGFTEAFKKAMDSDSWDCAPLKARYQVPEFRCREVVIRAADALEEYISQNAE